MLRRISFMALYCRPNQWTGFYMIGISVMKELKLLPWSFWYSALKRVSFSTKLNAPPFPNLIFFGYFSIAHFLFLNNIQYFDIFVQNQTLSFKQLSFFAICRRQFVLKYSTTLHPRVNIQYSNEQNKSSNVHFALEQRKFNF